MSIQIKLSDVIENQAIVNIGTAGHVAHGKSTLVKMFTGTSTPRYKSEKQRNITIKLGYANSKVYITPSTNRVHFLPSNTKTGKAVDPETNEHLKLSTQISFVDCPGHEKYIATMISGAGIMDLVLVVVAANEKIPQAQTKDHIIALEYSGIPQSNITYLLNKLDLVKPSKREAAHDSLVKFLDTYTYDEKSEEKQEHTIIPISAATGENIDVVAQHLATQIFKRIPETVRQANRSLCMHIVRSYDINKPSTKIEDMNGAVVGGTILSGVVGVGDWIEIRPGVINMIENEDGKTVKVIQPLIAQVQHLKSDSNDLEVAVPGGLVGVNLSLYSGLSSNDALAGQVLGHVNCLPHEIYDQITGKFNVPKLLVKPDLDFQCDLGDKIQLVVNKFNTVNATIKDIKIKTSKKSKRAKGGTMTVSLSRPVALDMSVPNFISIMKEGETVAALNVETATLSMPLHQPYIDKFELTPPPKREVINDLKEYTATEPLPSFSELSRKVTHAVQHSMTTKLPIPKVTLVHKSSYLSGEDMKELFSALDHAPEHGLSGKAKLLDLKHLFIENLGSDLTNSCPRFNSDGNLLLTNRFKQNQIKDFIEEFNNKLLRCPSCRDCNCYLYRENSLNSRCCLTCKSVTQLNSLKLREII